MERCRMSLVAQNGEWVGEKLRSFFRLVMACSDPRVRTASKRMRARCCYGCRACGFLRAAQGVRSAASAASSAGCDAGHEDERCRARRRGPQRCRRRFCQVLLAAVIPLAGSLLLCLFLGCLCWVTPLVADFVAPLPYCFFTCWCMPV